MARIHTHYDNLKVARNAPPEVIRAAYKTLSQKYHPDRNPNNPDAVRIIKIINSAYEVLSDPRKRQEHDEWIAREEAAQVNKTDAAPGFGFMADAHDLNAMRSAALRRNRDQGRRPRRHQKGSFKPWDAIVQLSRMIVDRFSKYIIRKV